MEDFYKDWLFRQYDMYSEYTGVLYILPCSFLRQKWIVI